MPSRLHAGWQTWSSSLSIGGQTWSPGRAEFRDFARAVIDAGADVFWGHSAHVVHGIEIWRGRPILYDTGDFVDDYATDRYLRNDLSALFLLHARPPAIEGIELIPVKIDHMRVSKAKGAERDWFVNRFRGLCAEMNTPVRVTDVSASPLTSSLRARLPGANDAAVTHC